jgi:hypothetical protein
MIKNKAKKEQNKPEKMSPSNKILIEHFDSKFDLLLDGYAMTNKKLDDLKDEFKNDLKEGLGSLRQEMNERFDVVDERFATIDEKFIEIDDKFEAVFDVLDDIKKEVKSVKI